jgi:hypothetical protein
MPFSSFARKYRSEMAAPEARQMIDLLAVAARQVPVQVGCFCEDESRCHRSVLLDLIEAAAAEQGGGRPLTPLGKFASPACSMAEIED